MHAPLCGLYLISALCRRLICGPSLLSVHCARIGPTWTAWADGLVRRLLHWRLVVVVGVEVCV